MKLETQVVLTIIVCVLMSGARARSPVDVLVEAAVEQDPWLQQSRSMEAALAEEAIAAGELPDPKFSAAIANIPMDTFSFSQEPMTQVKLGITQMFPPGDTRQLRRQQKESMAAVHRLEREHRVETVTRDVRQRWLDACLAELTVARINEDRDVFEQLVEVTRASYGSATRRVSQQDLIRAQVELTRLDERTLKLKENRDRHMKQLSEWVPPEHLVELYCELPTWAAGPQRQDQFLGHPEIRILDQNIQVQRDNLAVAEALRRPGWALNTSYAFRDQDRQGNGLSDFVSVGVTIDLPLFKRNRQDRKIAAAAERVNAMQSARVLKIRQLMARYSDARAQLQRLEEQSALYDELLLEQMTTLARSALNAYTSDQGDFADVMRAYIAQLNARIEAIRLRTETLKTIAQLDYLDADSGAKRGE